MSLQCKYDEYWLKKNADLIMESFNAVVKTKGVLPQNTIKDVKENLEEVSSHLRTLLINRQLLEPTEDLITLIERILRKAESALPFTHYELKELVTKIAQTCGILLEEMKSDKERTEKVYGYSQPYKVKTYDDKIPKEAYDSLLFNVALATRRDPLRRKRNTSNLSKDMVSDLIIRSYLRRKEERKKLYERYSK